MKRKLHILLAVGIGLTASVGWLQAKTVDVKNAAELLTAVKEASAGDTVKLAKGQYLLEERLLIDKPIAIVGTIKMNSAYDPNLKESTSIMSDPNADWPKDENGKIKNNLANLITIEKGTSGQNVLLKDFFVQNEIASGINAQSAMTTKLENIYSIHNANAGLLIHSKVEAKGLITYGNKWGGVNIDKGTPEYTPKFSFDGMTRISEPYKIWSELSNVSDVIELPENAGWQSYVIKGKDSEATKTYWTLSQLPIEYYGQFPNKDSKWAAGYTFVYAEGAPITIEQSSNAGFIKITGAEKYTLVELPEACNPVVFGGKKEGDVATSTVTMNSGRIHSLFGGGYGTGTSKQAKVTTNTILDIEGGRIHNIYGGGLYYSHSDNVSIKTASSLTSTGWLICGGFESGTTTGNNYVDFASSNNTVAKANLNIDGGKYSLIAMGGTDGAKAYIKEVTATIKNATITGGVFGNGSNGRSDKVTGTVTNCKFEGDAIEVAAINRGIVKSVSLTFDGCDFSKATNLHANLGATYRWGYDYNGSSAKVEGIPGDVSFTFKNCVNTPVVGVSDGLADANVILTGAKASIQKFEYDKDKFHTAFAINADKTWRFNNGLEIANDVTLTKTGKLNVAVSSTADLKTAVVTKADSINLAAGKYALTEQLNLDSKTVLTGILNATDSTIIEASGTWANLGKPNKHLVKIGANDVSLKNMVIQNNKNTDASGIHVYNALNAKLDNVISRNNAAAGLIVNGSTVAATNFRTSGNGWYGVNVDKGEGVQGTPVFTIGSGCFFAESDAIKTDLANAPASYVVSTEWIKIKKDSATYWVNAAAGGIDYAIISVPSTVVYGSANLPLISNADSTKTVTFSVPGNNGFVSIKAKAGDAKYDSLQILKPGKVDITMAVGDTTVTQQLEVLKRVITVSGITAERKTYNGKTDVTLKTNEVDVKGYLGSSSPFNAYSGVLASANAGNAVPVTLTATFTTSGDADLYDVTFATVTDTVKKAQLTITTAKPNAIDFGAATPTFSASESGFVNNETNSVLGGKLQFDCPATTTSLAGKYPINPFGYTSDNYTINYKADSLEVKAIAPTVELVSATVSADKAKVTAKGRIISNGGTPTTALKGGFTIGDADKATGLTVAKDGTFTAELSELGNATINVKATASATTLKGTSAATSIDLSLNLQNINFVSELSRLTYGSTAKLSAKDFAEGAKVEFTIAQEDGTFVEKVDSTTIKAVKPGQATITVTATKDGYITAIAKQTVTIEPKNLTVTPAAITKPYDGTLNATLPAFTLTGIVGTDAVTVKTNGVTASFVDKNVGKGKQVILTGDLSLNNGENYTLAQPTGLKGEITKGSDIKVVVSDVKRKYNEKTLKYTLKFMAGTNELTTAYTGQVVVSEPTTGKYAVSVNNVSFPNYGTVTVETASGDIMIEKGTPKVLTYNQNASTIGYELLDNEGWTDASATLVEEGGDKWYAQVTYNNGQTVRGASLQKQAPPAINWNFEELKSAQTKASVLNMTFGQSKTLVKQDGFTYAVSNTKVLTLTTTEDNKLQVNAVGVGTGAITATNANGAVAFISIQVNPATLTIVATGVDKAFDNTTTANVALTIENMPEGVALDMAGIQFNYESANVKDGLKVLASKPVTLTGANAANYQLKEANISGKIKERDLTLTSSINKYYDGSKTLALTNYSAEGLIAGEIIPTLNATFVDNTVGVNKNIELTSSDKNYKLVVTAVSGNIVKSTLDATLPATASSEDNLKKNVKLVVRETGTTVAWSAVAYEPIIKAEGNGSNVVYYISGGDNENYSVVYDKNQLGFKSDPTPTPDPDPVPVTGISLDKTELTLTRLSTYTLIATVAPDNADNKIVKWTSSDESIATVDANGKVTAVKVGKATITVTTMDGSKAATCQVTVDFATGLEEDLANTRIYTRNSMIYINPIQPLQATIISMAGKTAYDARINGATQISVAKGVYIVKLTNAGNTITTKVSVY